MTAYPECAPRHEIIAEHGRAYIHGQLTDVSTQSDSIEENLRSLEQPAVEKLPLLENVEKKHAWSGNGENVTTSAWLEELTNDLTVAPESRVLIPNRGEKKP